MTKDGLGKRLAYYIKGLNKTEFTKIVKMDYAHLHRIIRAVRTWNGNVKKNPEPISDLSLNWLVSSENIRAYSRRNV